MRRTIAQVLTAFLAICFISLADRAEAAEEILSYDVTVDVASNGLLDVEERIRVNAEGDQIKHGIFRDLPVSFRTEAGVVRRVGITVTSIMQDGHGVSWRSQPLTSVDRIYIGDKDVLLPHGVYEYTLRYRAAAQLRRFADHDEIQWYATGYWSFPILHVSARMSLPAGTRIVSKTAATGVLGANSHDWRISNESDNSVLFETTRALAPKEGLMIAVGFPKGVVSESGAIGQ